MNHYNYIEWLLIFFVAPTAVLWVFLFDHLWKYRNVFLYCSLVAIPFGLAWDYFAVITKLWWWPESCCIAYRLPAGVPFEEVLFISSATLMTSTIAIVVRDIYKNHMKAKHRAR
jgi:lycopene cyclase domain-containing protein